MKKLILFLLFIAPSTSWSDCKTIESESMTISIECEGKRTIPLTYTEIDYNCGKTKETTYCPGKDVGLDKCINKNASLPDLIESACRGKETAKKEISPIKEVSTKKGIALANNEADKEKKTGINKRLNSKNKKRKFLINCWNKEGKKVPFETDGTKSCKDSNLFDQNPIDSPSEKPTGKR